MRSIVLFILSLAASRCLGQDADESAIRNILLAQTQAWNTGNLDQFMSGYWQNDSLMFIGKSGVVYGFDSTLARYKRTYPNRAAMGKLVFVVKQVKRLSPEYYWVLGQWTLSRQSDKPGGHYTLLFRKIDGRWVIIADHTS